MKQLNFNLNTVRILMATFADIIQGIDEINEEHMAERIKEVDEFIQEHTNLITLLNVLTEYNND